MCCILKFFLSKCLYGNKRHHCVQYLSTYMYVAYDVFIFMHVFTILIIFEIMLLFNAGRTRQCDTT